MAIVDSGDRTTFSTGAVRDMHEGKGRCDLMPLDEVIEVLSHVDLGAEDIYPLKYISDFIKSGHTTSLSYAFDSFAATLQFEPNDATMPLVTDEQKVCNALLEVSKHFEEGSKKYGERNWQRGIPLHSFIDSAIRHYLKFKRGDADERHDRAFLWNILCAMWTVNNRPDMIDIVFEKKEDEGGAEIR